MLPAFGYPALRKFKHLVANFGTAWYNQSIEFADFPGPILMNSNCLIQPRDSYKHRLFTTHAVGWAGVNHVVDENYAKIIECAKKEAGFEANTPRF
jgi:hydroxylamine reductase